MLPISSKSFLEGSVNPGQSKPYFLPATLKFSQNSLVFSFNKFESVMSLCSFQTVYLTHFYIFPGETFLIMLTNFPSGVSYQLNIITIVFLADLYNILQYVVLLSKCTEKACEENTQHCYPNHVFLQSVDKCVHSKFFYCVNLF